MTAKIIDGKAFAAGFRQRIGAQVGTLVAEHGLTPGLTVVLVGEDPASQVYVRNKGKAADAAGIASGEIRLSESTPQAELLDIVRDLNADPAVHGILVQLPLPAHIDEAAVVAAIDPAKDVDGLNVVNAGRLVAGLDAMVPCTPLGCMMLIKDCRDALKGLRALVVGRSILVGKPVASLLLAEHCTVTIAHSRTRDLAEECRRADILVAAVGRPKMIAGDWINCYDDIVDVLNHINSSIR